MGENEISYAIRGAVFEVYNMLGPGLLESSYQHSLAYELGTRGLYVEQQVALPLNYKGIRLDAGIAWIWL